MFHTEHKNKEQAKIYKLENAMLEAIRKNWNIPECFSKNNDGASMLMTTTGNCSVVAIYLTKLDRLKKMGYDISKTTNHEDLKFVIYHYDVAHSHAEKAIILNDIIHKRQVNSVYDKDLNEFTFDYQKLEDLMDEDIKNGLIPLAAFGVFGATSNGSSDDITRFAEICKKR